MLGARLPGELGKVLEEGGLLGPLGLLSLEFLIDALAEPIAVLEEDVREQGVEPADAEEDGQEHHGHEHRGTFEHDPSPSTYAACGLAPPRAKPQAASSNAGPLPRAWPAPRAPARRSRPGCAARTTRWAA